MREYYFNEGHYQHSFSTKREATSAALKVANRTGKRVIVSYRNLGVEPQRVATMRSRSATGHGYKSNPERRLTEEQYTDAFRRGYDAAFNGKPLSINPFFGARARAWEAGYQYAEEMNGPTRSNPATLGRSAMRHRHRALDYRGALSDLIHKAHTIQAKPTAPKTRDHNFERETTVHSVEIKAGKLSHVELFNSKAQAQQWAKDARKQGFEAYVY